MTWMHPIHSRAARRLLLGAVCALPLACTAAQSPECILSPVGKLPLRYSGPKLNLTADGSINGVPATMLVATQAYETLLTRNGLERRNLKLRNTGYGGSGDDPPVYETLVQEFVAGPIRATRHTMIVVGSSGYAHSYDAILGAPFLLKADLEVSLATKELNFFVSKNCADAHLGYWDEKARVVPFEPRDESRMTPHFIVHINGQKMLAAISSTSNFSSVRSEAARRAGIAFDAPGARRGDDALGVNGKRAHWITTVPSFVIGGETIRNAELSVVDWGPEESNIDVWLGADFLRAYRVLFAMSQKKLYFSHVGGEPFGQRLKLEPWVQAEADNGNADAQFALANAYQEGKLVPRDDVRAAVWMEKAVAGGSAHALLESGRELVIRREYAAAAPRLRAALDKLPAERDTALMLYIARVRSGQAELAKTELAATFARSEGDEWPKPVADFYLGKLPLHTLLEQAAADRTRGKERRCSALSAMGDWYRAHGMTEAAKLRDAQLKATCSDTFQDYIAIGD